MSTASSARIKAVQKNQGMANGTPGGLAQQQATALCDISAQLQQYQQFLGQQHPRLLLLLLLLLLLDASVHL